MSLDSLPAAAFLRHAGWSTRSVMARQEYLVGSGGAEGDHLHPLDIPGAFFEFRSFHAIGLKGHNCRRPGHSGGLATIDRVL
jgi:hypothetical protein